jgi:hypothetical protein
LFVTANFVNGGKNRRSFLFSEESDTGFTVLRHSPWKKLVDFDEIVLHAFLNLILAEKAPSDSSWSGICN